MLNYVTIGANDLERSDRFYTAILSPLGYERRIEPDGITYSLPDGSGGTEGAGTIYVKTPFDGRPASSGNGSMLAFRLPTQKRVRVLHAAGLMAGGTDDGAPGFRAAYSERFYVGYLRDDVGNKIALFCNSPDEPTRPRD